MAGDWRLLVNQIDRAQVAIPTNAIVGAMAVISSKGRADKPILYQSISQLIEEQGEPSSVYHSVFDAIAFNSAYPLWVISAIGTGAKYGGCYVTSTGVKPWGAGVVTPSSMVFTSALQKDIEVLGVGNGITATFSGSTAYTPVTNDTFIIKTGTTSITCAMDGTGTVTGSVTGSVTLNTGAYTLTFSGTPGTPASYTSLIDASTTLDLSSGGTNKLINLNIDGTLYENIDLGKSATTARSDILTAINTAVGKTVASASSNFIKISGLIGDAVNGKIIISNPTAGASAVALVFDSAFTGTPINQDTASTSPIGAIPKNNSSVTMTYSYSADLSTSVSHIFYASSQRVDDLAIQIQYLSGSQFKLTLYTKQKNGDFAYKTDYTYSLIKEKDNFGKSLYIDDVFKNDPYLMYKVNSSFTGDFLSFPAPTTVYFYGGDRGSMPTDSDVQNQWDLFQSGNTYPATIFMDAFGNSANKLKTVVETYQKYTHAITPVPFGQGARTDAITYRQGLSLDTDNISLISNWSEIKDVYNDSSAWISGIGEVGLNIANNMAGSYGFASPAGMMENGMGGVLSYFTRTNMEVDYTDYDLQQLDNNQIDPITFVNGAIMMYGDKTLKLSLTDTSFIGTRIGYNYLITNIIEQVMKRQEFKNIDTLHMLKAKALTEAIINPVFAEGWLRDYKVICDDTNNTNQMKNMRRFVITVVVQVTPNAQTVQLNFIRVDQNTVVASVS